MTFTYAGTLATNLDYIRFKIQDTVASSGPKPSGGNFTDEEIAGLLLIEGTKERTIAALYETLATVWRKYIDTRVDVRDEKLSQIAAGYERDAKQWRAEFGFASASITVGFVTRVDAYSDDISAGET